MLRLKAERRSPSTVSGATASESRITKTPDVAHSTTTHHQRHPRTYEAPIRTWTDALAFFLFVAITVAAVFIAGYVLVAVLSVIGQMVTS